MQSVNPDPVAQAFCEYRRNFSVRQPVLVRMQYEDELIPVTIVDGLSTLPSPPIQSAAWASINTWTPTEKYLWVITPDDVRYVLEQGSSSKRFRRGRFTHTNLTGGETAHSGGEAWIYDNYTILINGGSSRYQPRNMHELVKIVESLRVLGYKAAHMGWDDDTNTPARIPRGDLSWT